MKFLSLASLLLFFGSFSAQTESKELPLFYSDYQDNQVYSVDMTSGGQGPIVIYTTSFENGVHVKQWKDKEWTDFGNFPEVVERGFVAIEYTLLGGAYYALVQDGLTWMILKKEDSEWKDYSKVTFHPDSVYFSHPTLSFIGEEPYVYERHYRTQELHMYENRNGVLVKQQLPHKDKVTSSFAAFRNGADFIGAYTTYARGFKGFNYHAWGTSMKMDNLSKGVDKKDVAEVLSLEEYNGKIYLHWLDKSWDLHTAYYYEYKNMWSELEHDDPTNGLGHYFADDQSYVTKSRDNDMPIFHKFDGKKWLKGEEIGSTKIFHGRNVELVYGGFSSYYLLQFDPQGKCIVQEIK